MCTEVFRSAVHGQETGKEVCKNVTEKIILGFRFFYCEGA
jgi:hypothetical protein